MTKKIHSFVTRAVSASTPSLSTASTVDQHAQLIQLSLTMIELKLFKPSTTCWKKLTNLIAKLSTFVSHWKF
jgi:hypothetical protein